MYSAGFKTIWDWLQFENIIFLQTVSICICIETTCRSVKVSPVELIKYPRFGSNVFSLGKKCCSLRQASWRDIALNTKYVTFDTVMLNVFEKNKSRFSGRTRFVGTNRP